MQISQVTVSATKSFYIKANSLTRGEKAFLGTFYGEEFLVSFNFFLFLSFLGVFSPPS